MKKEIKITIQKFRDQFENDAISLTKWSKEQRENGVDIKYTPIVRDHISDQLSKLTMEGIQRYRTPDVKQKQLLDIVKENMNLLGFLHGNTNSLIHDDTIQYQLTQKVKNFRKLGWDNGKEEYRDEVVKFFKENYNINVSVAVWFDSIRISHNGEY